MNQYKQQYNVAIIAPNCFYYQVDLYRELSEHPRINLTVYFCSDETLSNDDAAVMYGPGADWGLGGELLQGYSSKFLRNYSPLPSYLNSGVGLMNWGVWSEIKNNRPDVIIMMSWMNPTWWLSVGAALSFDIPFFLMTDANVHTEKNMSFGKKLLRKIILGQVLFRTCSGFLCAGNRNRSLYEAYGVPDRKLFSFAYSSGYGQLAKLADELVPCKQTLRKDLGFSQDDFIFLFCGRLSREKNLMHLLKTFHRLEKPDKILLIVGDGVLKCDLMEYVANNNVTGVHFLGFKNRSEILRYYSIADVFVLASCRETWGMVVNEAMCFRLPLILADAVGCIDDMLVEGINGFGYSSLDSEGLFLALNKISALSKEELVKMGVESYAIIKNWSARDLGLVMSHCLDQIYISK